MDPKEIKQILKNVKESLDAKDFQSALKQCKSILKNDRNNYLALVFFGATVQETDQKDEAPRVFKKAIEIKPDSDLAWRGLVSYYEKFQIPESNEELLKGYERLIVLGNEPSKYEDYMQKYENLAIKLQDNVLCKKLFDALDTMPKEKSSVLKKHLLNVFLSLPPNSDEETQKCLKTLLTELSQLNPDFPNHFTLCKKYLKLLCDEENFIDVISEGSKFHTYYPQDVFILQCVCSAYAELYCLSINIPSNELVFKDIYSLLLELYPESHIGHLSKGIYELQNMDLSSAIDSVRKSLRENSSFGLSWFVLCKCQILLYQFTDSESSAREAITCFKAESKNGKLISTCELWLIQSLSEQEPEEKLLEAVNLGNVFFERKSDSKEDVLPHLIKALIKLNRFAEIEKYLDILKECEKYVFLVEHLKCFCLKQKGNLSEYKTKLENLVGENPDYSEGWLELGKIHYSQKNGANSLSCLLKSAKLDQWCYFNFVYLGHYYKEFGNDLEKARRCYQKAFQLNPGCPETGTYLSEVYRILGKDDLNGQLLNLITTQRPKEKSGWVNLGIHYLSTNQYQEAVNSLRVAVRLDTNDRMIWEILADAYFYQGAYVSAAKAYAKVIELGSESVYPFLQLAVVKHLTGEYDESISQFREIIAKHPYYLPALKGHAEVCTALMKQYLSQNLNGLAMDNGQEAVNSLILCLELKKNLACIWKLLGDACVQFSNLPEKYCKLNISSSMVTEQNFRDGRNVAVFNKMEVLKLGARSYCEALALNPNSSGLWYDLGVCYNSMALYGNSPENKKEMRLLACSAVKKSLLVNEKNWESWNLFGIISASSDIENFPLAQHCFIRALEENVTSAVVWTNLGTLYLCLNDLKLANQSFAEAQRLDHDYVQCWIGQALIAQATDHHDAMDLFRHSNQLGIHPEGSLGYANLVCQTLLGTKNKNDKDYIYSIKNMNAIAVACDALTWYTDNITDNPCAFNMLGLLSERQKLYRKSCEAYQKAVLLLMANVGEKQEEKDVLDKALLNYGRSLTSVGKPEEAIKVLKQIHTANFVNQCGLAEAYFRAKKYEEAYSSYARTLERLAPDSGFKSHILVAMAAVVYRHQGKDDAKILLMQAFQLKPPSVEGLFACCALGMLHSDLSLSELSLKELSRYKDNSKYMHHIAVFESYIYLFKGEKEKAIRVLCRAIHRHPSQPSLWLALSLLLLHLYPSFDSRSAANCAEVTIKMGRSEIDVSKVLSLVSLSDLLSGDGLKSIRSSQKAVHMFPDETSNWVVLVASVISKCITLETEQELTWLKSTISYIRRKIEASKGMSQWLDNNEKEIAKMFDSLST